MKKSVYSLVLSDSVVEAADRAAYLSGTSRSNFINSILAEHLSCITPEKRMRNIFDILETFADGAEDFRIQRQPSESMFSLLSSLKYKYRPTIRYCIELYAGARNGTIGELKIIFRTQSAEFALLMKNFFIMWAKTEQKYIGRIFAEAPVEYGMGDGRFTRTLKLPSACKGTAEKELGEAISSYIQMFDKVLKEYVSLLPDEVHLKNMIEREYIYYLKNNEMVI